MINNLWNTMQVAPYNSNTFFKFDIKNMVNTMMNRKRYPIIYVTRDYLNRTVFSYLSCNYTRVNTRQHSILVTYKTKLFFKEKYFWLCRRQKIYKLHNLDDDDFIRVLLVQPGKYTNIKRY